MQQDHNIDIDAAIALSDPEDVVSLELQTEDVADAEAISLTQLDEHIITFNSNVVYIGSFLIVELGILIGVLLGFVFKGILKK